MSPILGIWASQISGHLYTPVGSYDALATVTVPSGGLTSISFSGIPTGYRHLQIRGIALSSSQFTSIYARFNGDSGNNYSEHFLYNTNPTVSSAASTSISGTTIGWTGGTTAPGGFVADILDYASSSKNKTVRTLIGTNNNTTNDYVAFQSSCWYNTSPITSMTLVMSNGSTLNQYTQFALYGIK